MKKLFVLLFVLAVSILTLAQTTYKGRMAFVDFGTVANSVDETGYVSLDGWSKIDSISVTAFGTGELDVDSIDVYVGVWNKALSRYSSTANTYTVTLNLAAAGLGFEQLYVSNATLLTGDKLRGVNALKVVTRGATSGNDATDPNKLIVGFQIWGTKE